MTTRSILKWLATPAIEQITSLYPPRTSAFRRSLNYLLGTDQKWKSRGSKDGLQLGNYYEFGVWNGDSVIEFWKILRGRDQQRNQAWHFYGFDTFQGLPAPRGYEDAHAFVGEGSFRSEGLSYVSERLVRAGIPAQQFTLTEGLFEETLTTDLKQGIPHPRTSIVNIDVDYSSSTVCALNWLHDVLIDGSIIYFDDISFYNGNPKKGQLHAIEDFNNSHHDCGLTPAPGLDPWGRVYFFWSDKNVGNDNLRF